ncbi:follitropin subunit beta [Pelobates fuscus]|uniref:follitropin subunit beta n=1 Tax=Pelobates fuscus TaxID=191477 RepID=UPI002FE4AE97
MEKLFLCLVVLCWNMILCSTCELSNVTIALEKEECGVCITVNATWCLGYCHTKDPSMKPIFTTKAQRVCTYKQVIYETVKLPGCPDNVDPYYSYPVATECHCGQCDMETSDCTVRGLGPSYCTQRQEKE